MTRRRSKPTIPRLATAAALASALLAAGAAHAEVAPAPSTPVIDLTVAKTAVAVSYAQAAALQAAGIVQTSVDHKFSGQGLTGSLGFLCGLQPAYYHAGAADARGYDPEGKFVGAKLAFAFK